MYPTRTIATWGTATAILGGSYILWGGWGLFLIAMLGIVVALIYGFVEYETDRQNRLNAMAGPPIELWWGEGRLAHQVAESQKRDDRARQLDHLETDLKHAKRLLELEDRARELRRQSMRSQRYSDGVDADLRALFEKIEAIKHGRR